MNTKIKTLIASLVALLSAMPIYAGEGSDLVYLQRKDEEGEVIHRAPELIPITCTIEESTLSVNFLDNLGYIVIEIENQATLEYSQITVNALAGPMVLPISGTSGNWTITFTLSSGVQYYGEFML